jgi:hypothetical protein
MIRSAARFVTPRLPRRPLRRGPVITPRAWAWLLTLALCTLLLWSGVR